MSKVVLLKIKFEQTLAPDGFNFLSLLSLGLGMARMAKRAGGRCVPLWLDRCLVLPIQKLTSREANSFLDPFIESTRRSAPKIIMLQENEAEFPTQLLAEDYCGPGSYKWERLTKRLFFSLSGGAWVQSTLLDRERKSIFSVRLGNRNNLFLRTLQWRQAVAVRASNHNCVVVNHILESGYAPMI